MFRTVSLPPRVPRKHKGGCVPGRNEEERPGSFSFLETRSRDSIAAAAAVKQHHGKEFVNDKTSVKGINETDRRGHKS